MCISMVVELRDVGTSDTPILVEASPPIPGHVTDGHVRGLDLCYQSSNSTYCGTWEGFYDLESGIGKDGKSQDSLSLQYTYLH